MSKTRQTIVITGASGRIGSKLAELLLKENYYVKAVSRKVSNLKSLENLGAETIESSLTDWQQLTKSFIGADILFVLSPVNLLASNVNDEQIKNIGGLIKAIRGSGVRKVVMLSSWGIELNEKSGGIIGCRIFEQELQRIYGLNLLILRPVWFMDNFLYNIDLIKMANINGMAIGSDVIFPMIAAADIAYVAADYILRDKINGKSIIYLKSEEAFTMQEVTSILGRTINKNKLRYVEFPKKIMLKGMESSGKLSKNAANMLIEINEAITEGRLRVNPAWPMIITPTKLQEFGNKQFAPAYRSAPNPSVFQKLGGIMLRLFLSITA